jgi:hypothetical protein
MKGVKFYRTMLEYVDIEKLRTKPIVKEDIWVYNYCMYEVKNRMTKTKLIKKYEREIFVDDIQVYKPKKK